MTGNADQVPDLKEPVRIEVDISSELLVLDRTKLTGSGESLNQCFESIQDRVPAMVRRI